MNAIELLKDSTERPRVYEINHSGRSSILPFIEEFEERHPGPDWQGCCELVQPTKEHGERLRLKNMVHWGTADATIFENHWDIQLPDWIHDFYNQVTEAVLLSRNVIQVLSPAAVVEHEDWVRGITKQTHLPIRLIRFAPILGEGDEFAFRQRVNNEQWEIVYAWSGETTEYYQSSEADASEHDNDINAWLTRMIETDGHPLMLGNEDIEFMDVVRVS